MDKLVGSMVEEMAPIVFEAMRWAAQQPLRGDPPAWQNGNSLAEGRARDAAADALAIAQKRVNELEAAQDALDELLDEAEDLCVALALSMDLALTAAGDDAPSFIVERANKSAEALREFYGRASRVRAALPTMLKGNGDG